jgi:hypothetical protein
MQVQGVKNFGQNGLPTGSADMRYTNSLSESPRVGQRKKVSLPIANEQRTPQGAQYHHKFCKTSALFLQTKVHNSVV